MFLPVDALHGRCTTERRALPGRPSLHNDDSSSHPPLPIPELHQQLDRRSGRRPKRCDSLDGVTRPIVSSQLLLGGPCCLGFRDTIEPSSRGQLKTNWRLGPIYQSKGGMRGEQASRFDIVVGSVAGGCLSTLLGHPLDTIKVHKQVNPALTNSSALQVVRYLSQGSIMRLFRGISAPMANQVLMNTVMFSTFDRTRSFASERLDGNAAAVGDGLLSGFATACLSTPADWFKIRSQMSLSSPFDGSTTSSLLSVLRMDAEMNGERRHLAVIRTIYRGHVANLCREGVFTMVYVR